MTAWKRYDRVLAGPDRTPGVVTNTHNGLVEVAVNDPNAGPIKQVWPHDQIHPRHGEGAA